MAKKENDPLRLVLPRSMRDELIVSSNKAFYEWYGQRDKRNKICFDGGFIATPDGDVLPSGHCQFLARDKTLLCDHWPAPGMADQTKCSHKLWGEYMTNHRAEKVMICKVCGKRGKPESLEPGYKNEPSPLLSVDSLLVSLGVQHSVAKQQRILPWVPVHASRVPINSFGRPLSAYNHLGVRGNLGARGSFAP